MAKRIKLLENEINLMYEAQMKMQGKMEALIKKTVKRASRLVLKAMEKLTMSNEVLQQVASTAEKMVGHTTKFEGIVSLQRTQYEEFRKVAEATTNFEGLPEVIKS